MVVTGEPLVGPLILNLHKISPVVTFAQVSTFALLITRNRLPEIDGLAVPGPNLLLFHISFNKSPSFESLRAVIPFDGTRRISLVGVVEGMVDAPPEKVASAFPLSGSIKSTPSFDCKTILVLFPELKNTGEVQFAAFGRSFFQIVFTFYILNPMVNEYASFSTWVTKTFEVISGEEDIPRPLAALVKS